MYRLAYPTQMKGIIVHSPHFALRTTPALASLLLSLGIVFALLVTGCGTETAVTAGEVQAVSDTETADTTETATNDGEASSDDEASSGDDGGASVEASETEGTVEGEEGVEAAETAEQLEPSDAPDPGDDAEQARASGEAGDFCSWAADMQEIEDQFLGSSPLDPVAFETAFTTVLAQVQEGARLAPPEISDDYAAQAESMASDAVALESYGWNVMAVPDGAFAEPPPGSTERIEAYIEETCGLDLDAVDAEPDGTVDPNVYAAMLQVDATEAEATCVAERINLNEYLDGGLILGALEEGPLRTVLLDCGVVPEEKLG